MKQKVKIISGWSDPGGSTASHISLTNLLNENGFDCTFYGPHSWHLDKCQSGELNSVILNSDDIVISHFLQFPTRPLKRHIYSCHEKAMTDLKSMNLSDFYCIQFVSNHQKKHHSVNWPSVIIPPIVDLFDWDNTKTGVAGVIGSVDSNKQTHKAIEAALKKGYEKVHIYGKIHEGVPYYKNNIVKYKTDPRVVFKGQYLDKKAMYDEIDEVFHFSQSETFGLVEAECRMNGIPYTGNHYHPEPATKEEILERWMKILKV